MRECVRVHVCAYCLTQCLDGSLRAPNQKERKAARRWATACRLKGLSTAQLWSFECPATTVGLKEACASSERLTRQTSRWSTNRIEQKHFFGQWIRQSSHDRHFCWRPLLVVWRCPFGTALSLILPQIFPWFYHSSFYIINPVYCKFLHIAPPRHRLLF